MAKADDTEKQKAALAKLGKESDKVCKENDAAEKAAMKLLKSIKSGK